MKKAPSSEATLDMQIPSATVDGQAPLISSSQLFKQHNTLRIEHQGQFYLLRVTRENKLILTK